MWQCKKCETINEDQSINCIICGNSRLEQEFSKDGTYQENTCDSKTSEEYYNSNDGYDQDAYGEESDVSDVDSYDGYEKKSMYNHMCLLYKWTFGICICVFIIIVFWPNLSATLSWNDSYTANENTYATTNVALIAASDATEEPREVDAIIDPVATLTPVITAEPPEIPVGSIEIDISSAKSENGSWVVPYEDDFSLQWDADNAYCYDVLLQGATGNVIIKKTDSAETYLNFASGDLPAGSYAFFVTAYSSSGVPDSTEELVFNIAVTNVHTELSDYLGTSLYAFVDKIDGMRDVGCTDGGTEYSNGAVTAYSPFDLDFITYIGLNRSTDYNIYGVTVDQSIQDATEILTDAGWRIIDKRETGIDYQDYEGNNICIYTENGNTVDSVDIYFSETMLEDIYQSYFNDDDDWGTYTGDVKMVYTSGDVYIRTGPGKNYESVGVIKAGNTVEYLGNSSTDERGVAWYNIRYNGTDGWVSSKYAELQY
jgi:uncharacterized protein YgiM (DUF1202 family)